MHGNNIPSVIADWNFSFKRTCNENYVIQMEIWQGPGMALDAFYWMVIVNEVIQSKEQVKLLMKYHLDY
jgi:hypothetical protein